MCKREASPLAAQEAHPLGKSARICDLYTFDKRAGKSFTRKGHLPGWLFSLLLSPL